jgi:CubicO group peptidase (beta-lactamase class C family)
VVFFPASQTCVNDTFGGISPLLGTEGDFTWSGANGTNFWVDGREQLGVVFTAHTPGPLRLHYRKVINALALQAITD